MVFRPALITSIRLGRVRAAQPLADLGRTGLALAAVVLVACGASQRATAGSARARRDDDLVRSNVLRGDYAGSAACGRCHAEIYRRWLKSPMHGMTRNADVAAIRAPFDGAVFHFKSDEARMETHGGQRFMRLHTRSGESLYRVTRVIGGRYREDFVGIDVSGSRDPETSPGHGEERVLPVSYVFSTASFRNKGYSVLVKERPWLAVAGVWRQDCIFCHNTVPYFATLYDDLLGGRRHGYQGSMANYVVPESRRWVAISSDPDKLMSALRDEMEFLGEHDVRVSSPEQALRDAIRVTWQRFGPQHFVEVGIGCESCHGGNREHVEDPRRRPTLEVRSDFLTERLAAAPHAPTHAQLVNRTCMRCHTVLFSYYRYTWEGGERHQHPGGSVISSGEARDFTLGRCSRKLSCTRCHDPHTEDSRQKLDALAGPDGTRLCASCHSALATSTAIAAHTHHDPAGPGSSCLNCHMPRKNLALSYRLTRYHRIGSPNDRARVEGDRPLECALCHTDRSVESLVTTMEHWWGGHYDRARLQGLYGEDLSVNPLLATLRRGHPNERAVAAMVLAGAGDRAVAGGIARLLNDPYPLVRYFAARALQELYGQWPRVDLDADALTIRAQAQEFLREQAARRSLTPLAASSQPSTAPR